jgi:hypothetical protein
MDKINACIVSYFMQNVDKKTVDVQRQVVDKYNPEKYPHYSILTDLRHGAAMDIAWAMNGIDHPTFKGHNVAKKFDHDVIFFLDVDAVPLNSSAIHDTITAASNGHLIGNVQRSNHIKNDQHLFVAPSCLAISVDSFVTIGKPSGLETSRGDVAEEYTYAAEKKGIVPVDFYMPLCYDSAPSEGGSWALKDGMPVYGRGTTFGVGEVPLFWHSFQIFHPGSQENFWKKCESILAIESK